VKTNNSWDYLPRAHFFKTRIKPHPDAENHNFARRNFFTGQQ
jgi:hypothetical protein